MISLARKLRLADFFSLGFGTMVGVGWLVVMDDWLLRGGPLGAVLAFAIGGLALLPIGIVYGHLVRAMPDAAGEIAYTAAVFPRPVSFATGWTMLLAYYIVCPWEAVAIGRIAGYLFPALNSVELYRVAGKPVFLPHLLLGLGLTAFITILNYRGIRLSATVQNWTTFAVLALTIGFVSAGISHGSARNLQPLFNGPAFVSVVLMLQVVPYFMTGFESIGKASEEASTDFQPSRFRLAILLAILVGSVFYATVTLAVAYVAPWENLVHERFATAVAFEHALGSPWIVRVIMATALLSLLKIFNGNFIAASRLLFGLGRRGLADNRLGYVHPRNRTPSAAVVCLGVATALLMFAGESLLVPITEVGSLAAPLGWMASCAAYLFMRPSRFGKAAAVTGIIVTTVMILIKVLPQVPGHFTLYEWIALGVWTVVGLLLRRNPREDAPAE
ncbi:MAG TPA: APC family permease [Candidatus Bathyarchaeia archaeon]|nr:APC family permease [Candidatus Bathyarchaeia archaeon]